MITADHRLPIYQRLKDDFAAKIGTGDWVRDMPVPSENQLAGEYRVAVGTVRKAIEGLVAEGLLQRQQGRGTFVRRPDFGNALFRFFRHADSSGAIVTPRARILRRRVAPADPVLASSLSLPPREPILRLFRERMIADKPLVVEDIAVEAARFSALTTLPLDRFGDLLYPLYDELCGQFVARATETISFGTADTRIAHALGIAHGEAVAIIGRIAFGADGRPLEWRRSYGPAANFNYTIDLK